MNRTTLWENKNISAKPDDPDNPPETKDPTALTDQTDPSPQTIDNTELYALLAIVSRAVCVCCCRGCLYNGTRFLLEQY